MAAAFISAEHVTGYEVLDRIGTGGMGVVYKARDLKLNRIVALKFLTDVDPADKQRLLREARTASSLDHPNIATVHAVEEADDGQLCIVMAYYQGETLTAALRHGPLPLPKLINIACQLARGLGYAHAHGVVHRDIKPSNVILTTDGVAKVVDFGLARQLSPSVPTESTGISGTLSYMSPEQASGKSADARSDIWSLGVVLYQMLTGRLPFSDPSAAATLLGILNSPPTPLSGAPEVLELVIYRALAKTPASRYQSCSELLKDLERLGPDDAQPTIAKGPDLHRQVRLAVRALKPRVSRRMLLVLVVLVLMVSAVVLSRFERYRAPSRSSRLEAASPAYDPYLKGRAYLLRYDKVENIDHAITRFQDAVKLDPQFPLAYAALGEAYWQKYRVKVDTRWLAPAEQYSKQALLLDDTLSTVHTVLGRVHEAKGQQELALQEFQRALKLDANNADAMLGRASIFAKEKRTAEAEVLFKTAAALRPDYWGGYQELAKFYFSQRRYEDAAREFRTVLGLVPDSAAVHASLGGTLLLLQRFSEAEAELLSSLKIEPNYFAYNNLGSLYYRQRRFDLAAKTLEKALEINADDYRMWQNLGIAYAWLGETEKARNAHKEELQRLERIVRDKPDDARVQAELGRMYAMKKEGGKAVSRVQASLALAPNDTFVLIDAAESYELLGQRPKAIQALKLALRKGTTMQDIGRDPWLRALLADTPIRRQLERLEVKR